MVWRFAQYHGSRNDNRLFQAHRRRFFANLEGQKRHFPLIFSRGGAERSSSCNRPATPKINASPALASDGLSSCSCCLGCSSWWIHSAAATPMGKFNAPWPRFKLPEKAATCSMRFAVLLRGGKDARCVRSAPSKHMALGRDHTTRSLTSLVKSSATHSASMPRRSADPAAPESTPHIATAAGPEAASCSSEQL